MTEPYRIFPRATAKERAEVKTSIQAIGLRCPVVVDEHGDIIDGHERRSICVELGVDWLAGADVRIGLRTPTFNIREGWRPVALFSPNPKTTRVLNININDTIIASPETEKDYHDWQQPLDVCIELMRRLTRAGDVILDPHLGTGTNAVAAALLKQRIFIGCDIDEQQVRTARYRVATEGKLVDTVDAPSPNELNHEVVARVD